MPTEYNVPQVRITGLLDLIYSVVTGDFSGVWPYLTDHREFFITLSILASLFLTTGIVYSIMRINQIRADERKKLNISAVDAFVQSRAERQAQDARWSRILDLAASQDPNNWRVAVLDADVMLDELVTTLGFTGGGLGERLKKIERSDFVTLDKAWEAHKIRNNVAHAGSDYILTQREARKAVALFEDVFKEFGIL